MECERHQGIVPPSDAEWHTRPPTEQETRQIVTAWDRGEDEVVLATICACVDPALLVQSLPDQVRDSIELDLVDMETVVLRS